jgi:NMD protein affecting ribosome stability and mRNA decay
MGELIEDGITTVTCDYCGFPKHHHKWYPDTATREFILTQCIELLSRKLRKLEERFPEKEKNPWKRP